MRDRLYNTKYHVSRDVTTRYSAELICGLLNEILDIRSVCDIGGGIGVWLNTFKKFPSFQEGIVLDGDYIDREQLLIKEEEFYPCDLENKIPIDSKFDLVICLEVAEHLSKGRAESFVREICKLGDVILFSAAIPLQGGTGHINEQPVSYWKNMFEQEGYKAFDIIRPNIQSDAKVCWWYKNNMMIYCNQDSDISSMLEKVKTPIMVDWVQLDTYLRNAQLVEPFKKMYRFIGKLFRF